MAVRVLVVDDSIVVRRLVTSALKEDNEIEIVGSASNGKQAVELATKFKPDVITLDIEMPEMNGLEALKVIKADCQDTQIIMFSTLTEHGAKATLDALSFGAADYVTKPANVGSVQESVNVLRTELVPKVKALGCRSATERMGKFTTANCAQLAGLKNPAASVIPDTFSGASKPSVVPAQVEAVVIGVSTGGPNALSELLPMIPGNLPVPICIVQHMPPVFTRLLAERLDEESAIKVVEATPGMALEAGKAVLAPGDFHMTIRKAGDKYTIGLNQDEKENSCRPAVDVMFRSAARAFGGRVISVVLTGMGHDGLLGANTLREGGAYVIAQDKETSVVWGMPGAVASANLADEILPLDQISGRLVALTRGKAPKPVGAS